MQLKNNIKIVGKTLFHTTSKTLILSDLHIGEELSQQKKGVLIPRNSFKELQKETKHLLENLRPLRVVLNGDIKHEYKTLSKQEIVQITSYLAFLKKQADLILIEGNHDIVLKELLSEYKFYEEYLLDGVLILHGHKMPSKDLLSKATTIVIGHQHPAMSLKLDQRVEKYKCFLKGKYEGLDLIVMPSMNNLNEGYDLQSAKSLSPILPNKFDDFEIFIVDDLVYYFGLIKNLKKI